MTPIPASCTWGRSRSTRSHTSTSSFLSQKPSRRSPRSVMTITRWVLFCRRHSSSSASSVGHSLCRDVSHSATTSGSSVSPGMRISSHGPGTPAARHLATCRRSGGAQHTRRLRQAVHTLYHAAHTDAHSAAAGDHRVRVAPQKCQIKFQLGILPHSDTSCLCSIRIKFNFNRNTIAILYHKSGSLSHLFAKFPCLFAPGKKRKPRRAFFF